MVTSKTIASNKIGKGEFTKRKVLDANNKWESPEGPGYQQKVGRNQELVETRDISGLDGVWTKQKEIAWNQQRLGCQSTNNVNNIYIYIYIWIHIPTELLECNQNGFRSVFQSACLLLCFKTAWHFAWHFKILKRIHDISMQSCRTEGEPGSNFHGIFQFQIF